MLEFYTRKGSPVTGEEWSKLYKGVSNRLGFTVLPDGKRVSTVFLGLNHRRDNDGPPLIFETMVFPPDDMLDLECKRYSTEQQAVEGHKTMILKWVMKMPWWSRLYWEIWGKL